MNGLRAIVVLLALTLAATLGATAEQAGPPNIVVIMSDDLSVTVLNGALANGWMPNLEATIIDQGTTFANVFTPDSVCCPSRATFLTGQHSHNHGVLTNTLPKGGVTKFRDRSTLATWLKAAGYRTGLVGKYLNGYGLNGNSSPKDDPTYIPPGWDDWQASIGQATMYNFTISDNGVLVTYGSQPSDYQTDVLAARAGAFITESDTGNDAQPFFLLLTPTAPHKEGPTLCQIGRPGGDGIGTVPPAPRHIGIANGLVLPQPPSFNESDVTDKPTWLASNYRLLTSTQVSCLETIYRDQVEAMLAVDDLIGTVVATLQTAGELNDTLIIFTSDNGYLLGEHRLAQKGLPYEGSVKVPLYIRAPGFAPSQTTQALAANIDLAPTIVEFAQATAGLTMDGRSLVPLLQDPAGPLWRTVFLIESTGTAAYPWPTYSGVRDRQYVYIQYVNGQQDLYDLATDPDELVSQHNTPAYNAIKNTMRQQLSNLKTCSGNSCWQ